MVWSYGVWLLWVEESVLETGLRAGYSLLDCDIWCEYDAIATEVELPR